MTQGAAAIGHGKSHIAHALDPPTESSHNRKQSSKSFAVWEAGKGERGHHARHGAAAAAAAAWRHNAKDR
jgi:hypothetical protein